MGRKLGVAVSIAVALTGILLFILSQSSDPDEKRTRDTVGSSPTERVEFDEPDLEGPAPEVADTEASEIDLEQGPGGLRGVVRDPDGTVSPGAEVVLYRSRLPAEVEEEGGLSLFRLIEIRGWGGAAMRELARADAIPFRPEIARGLERIAQVRADDRGEYLFRGLESGRYLLAAQGEATLETPTPSLQFVAEEESRVDIALIESGDLTGVVLGEDGSPVAGAKVRLRGDLIPQEGGFEGLYIGRDELLLFLLNPITGATRTDETGRFRFPDLPPMVYELFVNATPWAAAEKRHPVPEPAPVEIVLGVGGVIEGRAIDSDGFPAEGVEIALSSDEQGGGFGMLSGLRPMPDSTTDAEGEFRFDGVAPGAYRISGSGSGWRPADLRGLQVEAGAVLPVELTLEPGAVITGVVQDPAGAPVPEVTVSIRGNRGRPGISRPTDDEGVFILDTLAEGSHNLRFRREGWIGTEAEATTGAPSFVVTMERGPRVSGRIVDGDGRPVPRARVQNTNNWMPEVRAETDPEGRFAFPLSGNDASRIRIRAAGFAEATVDVPAGGGDLGDLVLASAIRIEGFVLDPDGQPLPGARVTANRDDPEAQQRWRQGTREMTGWTDGEGAFAIEIDDPLAVYAVRARFPLLLQSEELTVDPRGNDAIGLVLSLRWGASVFGTVVGAQNAPAEGASLELRATGDGGRGRGGTRRSARSDADGQYQIAGLEAGTYEIRVSTAGYAQTVVGDLALGMDEARRQDITLEPEQILYGVVVDDRRAPIERARVGVTESGAGRRSTSSDLGGEFRVDRLGRGDLRVTVDAAGFLRWRASDIFAEDGILEVEMRTAYEITGTVLDGGTGAPIAGARVRIRPAEDASNRRGRREEWSRTDEAGLFRLRNLDVGEFKIIVEAEGFIPTEVVDVVLPPRPSDDEIVVSLQPGGRVRGSIHDSIGRELGRVQVRAYRLPDDENAAPPRRRGRSVAQARSEENGDFAVLGLEEGRYLLRFEEPEFLVEEREVTIDLDLSESVLQVTLERGAEISGRVFAENGGTQESGNVFLQGPVRRRARLAAGGEYRFAGLPPGSYTIQFREGRSPPNPDQRLTVEIEALERRSLDLRL